MNERDPFTRNDEPGFDWDEDDAWAEETAARARRWRIVAIIVVVGLLIAYGGILVLDDLARG